MTCSRVKQISKTISVETPGKATEHRPEVRPQVQHLPHPQPNEHEGRAEAEPLDAVVGALVGVAQLLLARAQVVHLADNLRHHLLHAPQVGLDGLELLGRLDRRPVLGVGADVNVELDVADRFGEFCYGKGGRVLALVLCL